MASRAYNIPNLLTYARILAVPLIVVCFFVEGRLQSSDFARWSALTIFVVASITDYLDGYLARIWNQTSNIGKMLDPIADKLLIACDNGRFYTLIGANLLYEMLCVLPGVAHR